jgi:hypothetical protein
MIDPSDDLRRRDSSATPERTTTKNAARSDGSLADLSIAFVECFAAIRLSDSSRTDGLFP